LAVLDSKESWEHFRDGVLMPRMKKGIPAGLAGPLQETAFEVTTCKNKGAFRFREAVRVRVDAAGLALRS
jgi:hypothetical protein